MAILKHLLVCCAVPALSCIGLRMTTPELIPDEFSRFTPPPSWNKYGAYYIYDELFFEASYNESSWNPSPVNRIIYNKKLKILTNDGMAYGNIEMPLPGSEPDSFSVTLLDSVGVTIPVNIAKVKEEYLHKGVVVVPNVVPGCEISVYAGFKTYTAVPYYEFHFTREIPAAECRFTFSELSALEYEFRDNNLGFEPAVTELRAGDLGYRYHVYKALNVLPPVRLEFNLSPEQARQWVGIVLRRAFNRPIITGWNDIARSYRQIASNDNVAPGKKIEALIGDIQMKKRAGFDVADSLLQWIQGNIVRDDSDVKPVVLDDIIERRKGNLWEIADLTRACFQRTGLTADIVVSRIRSLGGFDKDFAVPLASGVPLVVVTIGDSSFVAFPFSRGGRLGEYPAEFDGLHGLSLNQLKPVPLPRSTSGSPRSSTRFTFDIDNEIVKQSLELVLYGAFAYETRTFLLSIERKKYDEYFQHWLSDLGTSNALLRCEAENVGQAGAPLRIHIDFTNPNQTIIKGTTLHLKLSNIFDQYFKSYDTLRSEDVVTTRCVDDTESIRIITHGAKVSPGFICNDIGNPLFSLHCAQSVLKDTVFFQRIVHIDSVTLDRNIMKTIYPDLVKLNRIRESAVSLTKKQPWKNGG